jgi:plasmid stability protein
MADLLIRDVPDYIMRYLTERAERNGTSVSDEAKKLLMKALALPDDREDNKKPSA